MLIHSLAVRGISQEDRKPGRSAPRPAGFLWSDLRAEPHSPATGSDWPKYYTGCRRTATTPPSHSRSHRMRSRSLWHGPHYPSRSTRPCPSRSRPYSGWPRCSPACRRPETTPQPVRTWSALQRPGGYQKRTRRRSSWHRRSQEDGGSRASSSRPVLPTRVRPLQW